MNLAPAMVPADEALVITLTIVMFTTVLLAWIGMNYRRKMAELELRKTGVDDRMAGEIGELKQAVGELREALNAQVIAVDNLLVQKGENSESLSNRLDIERP